MRGRLKACTNVWLVAAAAVLLLPASAAAQKDIPGGHDHPLVGRFPGSFIAIYDAKLFDEYVLPLGRQANLGRAWGRFQKIEGRTTRISYVAPKDAATLAILRSYEEALRKAGFEIMFRGGDADLAGYEWWYDERNPHAGDGTRRVHLLSGGSRQLMTARLARDEGDVYATVYATARDSNPTVQLDIIEVKPPERGLVTAQGLGEGLDRGGRVAIYTITFDVDKADIRPDSEPTLKEIATLLRGRPALRLHVVGHTDNSGSLAHNVDLSQRRAEAIARALVSRHGIDAGRLRSAGVGPLAPVAPNGTEDGRAKNRRVELVGQ